MRMITRLTASAAALLAGITLASAQTAQSGDPHHPNAQAEGARPLGARPLGARPMTPSAGQPGGMGMGNMTGGNMEQMMPMMRMMQMMSGMMPSDGAGMETMPGQRIEGRIAYLKAELGITEAQLPQWSAFADTMRESSKAMRTAMMATMQSGMPATAPARSDAMIAMMTSRLEAMKTTSAAGKALYAVLTDAQKKTADELMMSRMGGM